MMKPLTLRERVQIFLFGLSRVERERIEDRADDVVESLEQTVERLSDDLKKDKRKRRSE